MPDPVDRPREGGDRSFQDCFGQSPVTVRAAARGLDCSAENNGTSHADAVLTSRAPIGDLAAASARAQLGTRATPDLGNPGRISCPPDAATYDRYSRQAMIPRGLFLVTVPQDRNQWMVSRPAGAAVHAHTSFPRVPAPPAADNGRTARVPVGSRISPARPAGCSRTAAQRQHDEHGGRP